MKKLIAYIFVTALVASGIHINSQPDRTPEAFNPRVKPISPSFVIGTDAYLASESNPPRLYMLILGSDGYNTRKRCPDLTKKGSLKKTRADVFHLLGLNKNNRGTLLNFPRDTWVKIPRHGEDRINASLSYGGVPLAIKTVERLTDIDIQYWGVTTFCHFIRLVDAMGGVRVYIPKTFKDKQATWPYHGRCKKVYTIHKGWRTLKGCRALVYSRSRKAFNGDFDRTQHQGQLLIAGLKKLKSLGFKRTHYLMQRHVLFTRKYSKKNPMSRGEKIRLFNIANATNPKDIRNCTLPSYPDTERGMSVVKLKPRAYKIFTNVRKHAVTERKCFHG